ncbi:hypothetical protein Y1Q_0006467 [Alligator mississippiensis]|uniref:Uncharacterized protein n=1 Tax=Alligator mississippiensis TaxID=8496 RepID=A0A151MVG3_ALLMI|nr:hypothetical protein Y1Q_0006467 [Alligator mississippiensis]
MRCLGTIFIWMLTIQERSVRGFLLKGGQGQRKTCSPGGSLLGSPEALHEPVVRDLGGSHQIYSSVNSRKEHISESPRCGHLGHRGHF